PKLKYADASEVAMVLRDVYREQMNENPQQTTVGGFGGFAFGRGFGGRRGGGVDTAGNPRTASLSLGVDYRNNALVLSCSENMKKDIEKLIAEMEEGAKS